MKSHTFNYAIAISAGMLLALMIAYNSQLAGYSSPVAAAWIAHGIGTVVAILLVFVLTGKQKKSLKVENKPPLWSYLGGVPGALTVVLAAITVNSRLGLSSSLALMLVGKIMFGFFCDGLGLLGAKKRRLRFYDFIIGFTIFIGSLLIITFRV